jgi:hypothetical protein
MLIFKFWPFFFKREQINRWVVKQKKILKLSGYYKKYDVFKWKI